MILDNYERKMELMGKCVASKKFYMSDDIDIFDKIIDWICENCPEYNGQFESIEIDVSMKRKDDDINNDDLERYEVEDDVERLLTPLRNHNKSIQVPVRKITSKSISMSHRKEDQRSES